MELWNSGMMGKKVIALALITSERVDHYSILGGPD
jgi:hypothetical protein